MTSICRKGCKFYTDTSLPDPYPGQHYAPSWPTTPTEIPYDQGYAAIYLSGLTQMNIGFVGATGDDRNKIYQMRNGIILRGSVADISGTDFYDFEGKISLSEVNITQIIDDPVLDLNQHAVNMYRSTSRVEDNTFDNLMVGIYGLESINTIHDNTIELSTPSPGFGFTRGITFFRPQQAIITDNVIDEGMRGITIEDVINDFVIEDNVLNTSYYFLGLNTRILIRTANLGKTDGEITSNIIEIDDALASTGIHLLNASSITVDDNEIDFINGDDHQTRGIIGVGISDCFITKNTVNGEVEHVANENHGIEFSTSYFNTAFCNDVTNFHINEYMFGLNFRTNIVSNELNNSDYGFALYSPTMLGTQFHHGNIWPVSYGEKGAYIFGKDPVEETNWSRFYVDELEDSDFMPPTIGPPSIDNGVWFINHDILATKTCLTVQPPPIANADSLSKIITSSLSFDQFNDEVIWSVKADVYNMILSDTSLKSNAVLDSFFDAEENSALGKLIKWQNDLTTRFGDLRSVKEPTQDTIVYFSEEVVYIDSIIATSPNDSATWIALRKLKVDTLVSEYGQWLDILEDEEDDSQDAYVDIEEELDTLTTTNDLEDYLKDALLFRFQYLTDSTFTTSDSSGILELSELCPWEGDRAMVMGQSLYSTISNNMELPSLDECPSTSPFNSNPVFITPYEGEVFNIIPNPAIDEVDVVCNEKILELVLYNLNMQPMSVYNPNQRKISLNVGNYPPGIYIVVVSTENGIQAKRLVRN